MTTEYLKQRSTSRQVNQKYRIQVKAGPGLFWRYEKFTVPYLIQYLLEELQILTYYSLKIIRNQEVYAKNDNV